MLQKTKAPQIQILRFQNQSKIPPPHLAQAHKLMSREMLYVCSKPDLQKQSNDSATYVESTRTLQTSIQTKVIL
jgi:hypothetical protein